MCREGIRGQRDLLFQMSNESIRWKGSKRKPWGELGQHYGRICDLPEACLVLDCFSRALKTKCELGFCYILLSTEQLKWTDDKWLQSVKSPSCSAAWLVYAAKPIVKSTYYFSAAVGLHWLGSKLCWVSLQWEACLQTQSVWSVRSQTSLQQRLAVPTASGKHHWMKRTPTSNGCTRGDHPALPVWQLSLPVLPHGCLFCANAFWLLKLQTLEPVQKQSALVQLFLYCFVSWALNLFLKEQWFEHSGIGKWLVGPSTVTVTNFMLKLCRGLCKFPLWIAIVTDSWVLGMK